MKRIELNLPVDNAKKELKHIAMKLLKKLIE